MQYFVTNAFTSQPFSGNPATVCVPCTSFAKGLTPERMQRIAGELSSVETAFVLPATQPKTDFSLRFFTKKKENPFCGHATIAAAHILSSEFGFRSNQFFFTTLNGLVVVERKNGKYYELNLRPTLPMKIGDQWEREGRVLQDIVEALNFQSISPDGSSAVAMPYEEVKGHLVAALLHKQSKNIILCFDAAWVVMSAKPNIAALIKACPPNATNKVTITAVPTDTKQNSNVYNEGVEAKWRKYDFITRLFAPWFGIDEDAVSGASHAILAKLWREYSEKVREKKDLVCFQPSPRGGEVLVDVQDSERIGVSGEAVTIAHGSTTFSKSSL